MRVQEQSLNTPTLTLTQHLCTLGLRIWLLISFYSVYTFNAIEYLKHFIQKASEYRCVDDLTFVSTSRSTDMNVLHKLETPTWHEHITTKFNPSECVPVLVWVVCEEHPDVLLSVSRPCGASGCSQKVFPEENRPPCESVWLLKRDEVLALIESSQSACSCSTKHLHAFRVCNAQPSSPFEG